MLQVTKLVRLSEAAFSGVGATAKMGTVGVIGFEARPYQEEQGYNLLRADRVQL